MHYVPDSAGSAILFLEDVRSHNVTPLAHVIFQILPLRLEGQIAHEQPPALHVFAIGIALLNHDLTLIAQTPPQVPAPTVSMAILVATSLLIRPEFSFISILSPTKTATLAHLASSVRARSEPASKL